MRKKIKLKKGDKVIVYGASQTGSVQGTTKGRFGMVEFVFEEELLVNVSLRSKEDGNPYTFHVKQCRKIEPPKGRRITKKMLAKAWGTTYEEAIKSYMFLQLCEKLELT